METPPSSLKHWFFAKISRDLTVIFAAGWLILFVLEQLKGGIVSNYLSLPHTALIVGILLLISLWFDAPEKSRGIRPEWSRNEVIVLSVLSVIIAVSIPLMTQIGQALTVLLILVSVSALWSAVYMLKEDKKV